MSKFLFFVDQTWRIDGARPTPLLYPFWGVPAYEHSPFLKAIFAQHVFDTDAYGITSDLAVADCILDPYPLHARDATTTAVREQVQKVSRTSGLPVLYDGIGDRELPLPSQHAFVLRYGGYHFTRTRHDIIIPVFAEDLLEGYCGGTLNKLEKPEMPSISFAGWTKIGLRRYVRAFAKDMPILMRGLIDPKRLAMRKGIFFRQKALRVLRSSPRVNVRVVERSAFAGHAKTMEASAEEMRHDFVRVVRECLYGLDVRGDANNTSRLFEILSLGRIPVIVDTERNFPFEDTVDYSAFSLRVDFHDIARLPDILADFHARTSGDVLRTMQEKARAAFVEHFRVDAIARGVVRELRSRISARATVQV